MEHGHRIANRASVVHGDPLHRPGAAPNGSVRGHPAGDACIVTITQCDHAGDGDADRSTAGDANGRTTGDADDAPIANGDGQATRPADGAPNRSTDSYATVCRPSQPNGATTAPMRWRYSTVPAGGAAAWEPIDRR